MLFRSEKQPEKQPEKKEEKKEEKGEKSFTEERISLGFSLFTEIGREQPKRARRENGRQKSSLLLVSLVFLFFSTFLSLVFPFFLSCFFLLLSSLSFLSFCLSSQ